MPKRKQAVVDDDDVDVNVDIEQQQEEKDVNLNIVTVVIGTYDETIVGYEVIIEADEEDAIRMMYKKSFINASSPSSLRSLHCSSNYLVSCSNNDERIKIFNMDKKEEMGRLQRKEDGAACDVTFSPDQSFMLSSYFDSTISFWRTSDWEPLETKKAHTTREEIKLAIHPSSKVLLTVSPFSRAYALKKARNMKKNHKKQKKMAKKLQQIASDDEEEEDNDDDENSNTTSSNSEKSTTSKEQQLQLLQQKKYNPAEYRHFELKMWNLMTAKCVFNTIIRLKAVNTLFNTNTSLSFSPSGNLYAVSHTCIFVLFDVKGNKKRRIELQKPALCFKFITDDYVVIGQEEGALQLFDLSTGAVVTSFVAHKTRIKGISVISKDDLSSSTASTSNDNSSSESRLDYYLFSASSDGHICGWALNKVKLDSENESNSPSLSISTSERITCLSLWHPNLSKLATVVEDTSNSNAENSKNETTATVAHEEKVDASKNKKRKLQRNSSPRKKRKTNRKQSGT